MPLISQFYGILIYLYKELGGHHNKPHIHVKNKTKGVKDTKCNICIKFMIIKFKVLFLLQK